MNIPAFFSSISASLRLCVKNAWSHIAANRETYLFPLLAIALLLCAIIGIHALTGRPIVDDPSAIVGWCINFAGIILIFALVGLVRGHLFDDYDTFKLLGDIRSQQIDWLAKLLIGLLVIIDSCTTVFLLLFSAHYLWH